MSGSPPYHLQVSPRQALSGDHLDEWFLQVDHFQGDHRHDDQARRVWLAIAPHMAPEATVEFLGDGFEDWRIRWQDGRAFEEYVAQVVWALNEGIAPQV